MAYYEPSGMAADIFNERYTIHPGETWVEASNRLADHVASVEVDANKEQVAEEFFEEIVTNRFMPGGRIWYGSGRPRAQLLNCFVTQMPGDSREGWGKTISDVIVISGMGGGVGINFSSIRPRGSKIFGTGGEATGAVSLMDMINGVGDVLVGGGGRRLALKLDLNITHPDMMEFVNAKLDKKRLTNANVSLMLDKRLGARDFIGKVRKGKTFNSYWAGQVTGEVNAKELWELIVENALGSGEPGILNGDLANRESNIAYYKPLVSTNPCGEIFLEENGCCCLGALVLPQFLDPVSGVKWDQLKQTIQTAVRFLDNVLSVSEYPLADIRDNCNNVRRIGLGIMGLHDLLIRLQYKYSSQAGRDFVSNLMKFIKEEAYKASIDLAVEKGPFSAYQDEYLDSGFIRRAIPKNIQKEISKHGIRNCALLTIAPTGTTGMVSNVSTGIEPIFAPAYNRRRNVAESGGYLSSVTELVLNPLWEELEKNGQSLDVLEGAYDIAPANHFDMQVVCQEHIDNAVSKTINLPEDYKADSLSDLWLEYLPYLKGTTLYRAGSRGQEPLQIVSLEDAKRLISEGNITAESKINEQNMMDCVGDNCFIPEDLKVQAPPLFMPTIALV